MIAQVAVDAIGIIKEGANEAGGGDGWALATTIIITLGSVAAAALAAWGVIRAGAARNEASNTREENRLDHGRVADAIERLVAEVAAQKAEMSHRFDQLGQSVGDVREAHLRHLEWHVDKPTKEGSS